MTKDSKRLIKFGFLSSKGKKELSKLSSDELKERLAQMSDEEAEVYADHHDLEVVGDQMVKTPYPKPVNAYHFNHEQFGKPLEAYYFWLVNHFADIGFPEVTKITDLFAASEMSSFYGQSSQRRGLAQDKVSQYLGTIGQMVRTLFQVVREIRVMQERMTYYKESASKDPKIRGPAEIALKAIWVDMVEGGAKNAGSVYGLANTVQFVTLPDLFFSIHPKKTTDIGKVIEQEAGEFNKKVREVLSRKLYQYLAWKDATEVELEGRIAQTKSYLRQHYDAIQLYLSWIKPYLKHVKKLGLSPDKMNSAEIVSAFEGSMIEVELLAQKVAKDESKYFSVIVLNLQFRTSATLPFQQEYQHRGPLHVGKFVGVWRSYGWDQKTINKYVEMRRDEDLELLGSINSSIQESIQALGDDLKDMLKRQDEKSPTGWKDKPAPKKEYYYNRTFFDKMMGLPGTKMEAVALEDQKPSQSLFEPFLAIGSGVGDIFKAFTGGFANKPKSSGGGDKKGAEKGAKSMCWLHYRNFKKAHRFVTW